MRRAARLGLAWLALIAAAAAVVLIVRPPGWPEAAWLGAAAVALALIARQVATGGHRLRHRGGGRHARPRLVAEARALAARQEPPPPPGPVMAERAAQAAVALAAAAVPAGAHHRAGVWGAAPDCPDPARCGNSPWCPGSPRCLDPAPVSSHGRVILAPGKIPVGPPGRHERTGEREQAHAS